MVSLRERCSYHESGHVLAAIVFGVPLVRVSIDADVGPHTHCARWRAAHPDLGLESMVILTCAGRAAEELFCGTDGADADQGDLANARAYLARAIANPLQAAVQLSLYKSAAERLVRSEFARDRIRVLADALLRHGTLSGEQIHRI